MSEAELISRRLFELTSNRSCGKQRLSIVARSQHVANYTHANSDFHNKCVRVTDPGRTEPDVTNGRLWQGNSSALLTAKDESKGELEGAGAAWDLPSIIR